MRNEKKKICDTRIPTTTLILLFFFFGQGLHIGCIIWPPPFASSRRYFLPHFSNSRHTYWHITITSTSTSSDDEPTRPSIYYRKASKKRRPSSYEWANETKFFVFFFVPLSYMGKEFLGFGQGAIREFFFVIQLRRGRECDSAERANAALFSWGPSWGMAGVFVWVWD